MEIESRCYSGSQSSPSRWHNLVHDDGSTRKKKNKKHPFQQHSIAQHRTTRRVPASEHPTSDQSRPQHAGRESVAIAVCPPQERKQTHERIDWYRWSYHHVRIDHSTYNLRITFPCVIASTVHVIGYISQGMCGGDSVVEWTAPQLVEGRQRRIVSSLDRTSTRRRRCSPLNEYLVH